MARTYTVKRAQKDQGTCRRCGATIAKGDAYRWRKPYRGRKVKLCASTKCRFRFSDTSGAKYAGLVDAIDDARDSIADATPEFDAASISDSGESFLAEIRSLLEEVGSEADSVAEEYESSADAMDEHFPGSEKVEQCREAAENLRAFQGECEGWDHDSCDEREEDETEGEARERFEQWCKDARDSAESKLDEFEEPEVGY